MSTTEPTAEDHVREALRFTARAEEVDVTFAGYEATTRRTNYLQAAQVHATLAQVAKAAEMLSMMAALMESVTPAQPEIQAAGEEVCPGGC